MLNLPEISELISHLYIDCNYPREGIEAILYIIIPNGLLDTILYPFFTAQRLIDYMYWHFMLPLYWEQIDPGNLHTYTRIYGWCVMGPIALTLQLLPWYLIRRIQYIEMYRK